MMFCLSETAKKMARQNKNWLIRHDPPAQPAMTKSLVAEHLQFTTERQKHKIVMTMSRGARNWKDKKVTSRQGLADVPYIKSGTEPMISALINQHPNRVLSLPCWKESVFWQTLDSRKNIGIKMQDRTKDDDKFNNTKNYAIPDLVFAPSNDLQHEGKCNHDCTDIQCFLEDPILKEKKNPACWVQCHLCRRRGESDIANCVSKSTDLYLQHTCRFLRPTIALNFRMASCAQFVLCIGVDESKSQFNWCMFCHIMAKQKFDACFVTLPVKICCF